MRRALYLRLALTNIRKNGRIYGPYALTCAAASAMLFIVYSLSQSSGVAAIDGSLPMLLGFCSAVTGLFLAVFLFYTNSFLMKRRKKEFGLLNLLGLERRHIGRVLLWETLILAAICLTAGLLLGALLGKLVFWALLKLLAVPPMAFEILPQALLVTALVFGGVFLAILLSSLLQIRLSKPIELLKGGQTGEREPKTRWLLAAVGFLCLGGGYYLALSIKAPLAAMGMFFVAVVLVMLGTWALFTAGSVLVLKLLRANKGFYYKARNFISVSGLMYRMKQNAVGLANICILSTAVLVTVSSTLSLYVGLENVIQNRFPQEIVIRAGAGQDEALQALAARSVNEQGLAMEGMVSYTYVPFSVVEVEGGFRASPDDILLGAMDNMKILVAMCLEDYNLSTAQPETLESGQVLVFSNRTPLARDSFVLFEKLYSVKARLSAVPGGNLMAEIMNDCHFIVFSDRAELESVFQGQRAAYEEHSYYQLQYSLSFDLSGSEEAILAITRSVREGIRTQGLSGYVECRTASREGMITLHGGFFFIGAFLGLIFLMAMVLIMYYKQVSEGYDDRERFRILQNVGMSRAEVRKTIQTQVLGVFFLPLVTAGLHMLAAFPAISRILRVFNLTDAGLFGLCCAACFGVFALLYCVVYMLTARSYYRIVR